MKLDHLAYQKLEGKSPTVIFLTGFRSDMEGGKALFVESICRELGNAFIRFDYSGHGQSGRDFKESTISDWKDDTLKIIDELTTGKVILIGSSMGGWVMLLAALARPERVSGLVGIASAADFTEELVWQKGTPAQQQEILQNGFIDLPNCYEGEPTYPITKKLIEDGRKHLLLQNPIYINCPVALLHGMQDADVPYQTSLRIAEKITSQNVRIHLVKNGIHRMSEPENLALLKNALLDILI